MIYDDHTKVVDALRKAGYIELHQVEPHFYHGVQDRDSVDISTDNPWELSDNEVADNLRDMFPHSLDVRQSRNKIAVSGTFDEWRGYLDIFNPITPEKVERVAREVLTQSPFNRLYIPERKALVEAILARLKEEA